MKEETCALLLEKNKTETRKGLSKFFSRGASCLPKNSPRSLLRNSCRRLLLALLNKVSQESKYSSGNPNAPVPVYDITSAGPRHRFATPNFIVSNCLALGYGAGYAKFIVMASAFGLDVTEKDEEYALRASVDGKIHRRAVVAGKWKYETLPHISPAWDWSGGQGDSAFLSEQELEENECVRCVFVLHKPRRDGDRPALKAYPVLGMQSRVTVEDFRASNARIVSLWAAMEEGLRNSVGEDFVVTLPSGRALTYRKVRKERRTRVDPDTKQVIETCGFSAEISGRRVHLYGALIVENVCQSVGRDVFAERMLDLHDQLQQENPEQWVLFSVHDEAVPEMFVTDSEATRKRIEAVFSITPDWLAGCPIAAECKVTPRYLK